jgi:hypothetical protein
METYDMYNSASAIIKLKVKKVLWVIVFVYLTTDQY